MVSKGILFEENGILAMGHAGEREFGYRNFMELFSVFSSPPLVSVFYGQSEIGQVHELDVSAQEMRGLPCSPLRGEAGSSTISIGRVDGPMSSRLILPARSRWVGAAQPMHLQLCQASQRYLGALTQRSISRSAPMPSCKRLEQITPG